MPIKASKISMLLMLTIFAFPTPSFATFLLCPSVQEAKNLLQSCRNVLTAGMRNNGDASSAKILHADCFADRSMTNPGVLLSKEHRIMNKGGIVNASHQFPKIVRQPVVPGSFGVHRAWLFKKVINGRVHGVIQVK